MKAPIKFIRFIPQPKRPNVEVVNYLTHLQYEAQYKLYEKAVQEHKKYSEMIEDILEGEIQVSDQFVAESFPFYQKNFFIPITEDHRTRHTYITGMTGSGKSEVIKSLIWHYLNHYPNSAIVLIAPENDICEQVAKFNINYTNDKLVYIQPSFKGEFFPCINPFDIPNKSTLSTAQAEFYSQAFISVFLEALEAVGAEASAIMEIFLKSIIPVLMKYENASIQDMIDFLDTDKQTQGKNKDEMESKAQKYITFAEQAFPDNPQIANRLRRFVEDSSMKAIKNAIYARLQIIFGSYIMQKFFIGKSTINIKELLLQKKLIVINLPKGEFLEESKVIGKMLVAMIKNIALQRHSNFYCHLFIDEFHNFATKSITEILEELRKFKLFLTIAQQQLGQKLTPEETDAILGNTGVKLVGTNNRDNLNAFSKEICTQVDKLQENLKKGVFACWKIGIDETTQPAKLVRMPRNTLGHKKSMTDEEWQQIESEQIQKYYRSIHHTSVKNVEIKTLLDEDISSHLN